MAVTIFQRTYEPVEGRPEVQFRVQKRQRTPGPMHVWHSPLTGQLHETYEEAEERGSWINSDSFEVRIVKETIISEIVGISAEESQ